MTATRRPDRRATGVGRRAFLRGGLLAGGAAGAGLALGGPLALIIPAAAASASADDTQRLQTAAAIENLAVALYTRVSGLPGGVSGAGNPVLAAFLENSAHQHAAAAAAFNGAITAAGAKEQTGVDTALQEKVVTSALAAAHTPYEVLTVALNLEDAAAQTLVQFGADSDPRGSAFPLFATIAPVAAQRVAVLRAFTGLLVLGAAQLIQLPAPMAQLPAIAGDVAFPDATYPTRSARPAAEGAVS